MRGRTSQLGRWQVGLKEAAGIQRNYLPALCPSWTRGQEEDHWRGQNPEGWVPVMGHATHSSWCQIGSLSAGWLEHESALFIWAQRRERGRPGYQSARAALVSGQVDNPRSGRDPTRATHPGSDNPRNFSPWAGATASLLPGSAHVSPCQGSSWAGSRGNPGDTGVATADVGGGYTQRSCRQLGRGWGRCLVDTHLRLPIWSGPVWCWRWCDCNWIRFILGSCSRPPVVEVGLQSHCW